MKRDKGEVKKKIEGSDGEDGGKEVKTMSRSEPSVEKCNI